MVLRCQASLAIMNASPRTGYSVEELSSSLVREYLSRKVREGVMVQVANIVDERQRRKPTTSLPFHRALKEHWQSLMRSYPCPRKG